MAISDQLYREIEQFVYREGRILDERRYRDWLDLFTDDIRYWAPVRTTRLQKISKAIAILDRESYVEEELSQEGEIGFFDETKQTLDQRVARLETGMAWAEDPPSRTCRFLSNIEVEEGASAAEVKVYCNFIVHRSRLETEIDFYVGHRQDVLRKVEGEWKIARRTIVLNMNTLLPKNISIFL